MNEGSPKLPKNIEDLLNSVELKKGGSGDISSPEKENSLPEKEIAELEIEGLIGSRAQEKDTITELEKIIKNYPEFKEKIKTELIEAISRVGKKIDEAITIDKLKNGKEERTVIENDGQKEIITLRNEFLALKNIKKHFFEEPPKEDEDEEE